MRLPCLRAGRIAGRANVSGVGRGWLCKGDGSYGGGAQVAHGHGGRRAGAFIGPVHKMAAELDGKIELVAGAFSQSAERSRQAGERFGIDPARAYADYEEMLEAERQRADGSTLW